jgi:hypothetical protein
MSAPDRRLTIAITAAAASVTMAVGVTAASLLGWFAPAGAVSSEPAATVERAEPSIVYVPIAPEPTSPSDGVTLATSDGDAWHEDDEHEPRNRHHHHEHDDDDD